MVVDSTVPVPDDDHYFMGLALELAQEGLFTADPNPRVGCVLVQAGQVIGSGAHLLAGCDHAEVVALKSVAAKGISSAGATAYVTLEPCSHTGKTPPCADALIVANVGRVVVAMQDPSPKVAGKGIAALQAQGISVTVGVREAEARQLNPGFFKRFTQNLPWVRLKMAASLDGRTALASGESQWITGVAAREDVQFERARSSAIITGRGTVVSDNAKLTVRPDTWQNRTYPKNVRSLAVDASAVSSSVIESASVIESTVRQPVRIVLDSHFSLNPNKAIFQQLGVSYWVGLAKAQEKGRRDDSIECDTVSVEQLSDTVFKTYMPSNEAGSINLTSLLVWLASIECNEVLIEAGPVLAGSFISADLVDELIIYLGPTFLGSDAKSLAELSVPFLSHAPHYQFQSIRQIGEDVKLILARS